MMKNMTDISVIILVGKEELHIKRCLEKLAALEPRDVALCTIVGGTPTKFIKNRKLKGE